MSAQLTVPAKITQPHPRGVYLRTRLFDKLRAAKDTPCIWVCGPPGAGKTTLAASFCDQKENPTLWYQVDEGDADVASFFYYLNQAAKRVTRRRKNLPLFDSALAGSLTTFSRRYFERLYSWFERPLTFVLDNYQTVDSSAQIHDVIVAALDTLPAGSQVMVLSREEPPAEFARLRANQDMQVVDWSALRLDRDEVGVIAQSHNSDQLSPRELHELEIRCDGWVAGLVLMLQGEVQAMPRDRHPRNEPPRAMFDYFAQEIFRQQPKDVQTILTQAALLPKMNARTVRKLTDHTNAGRILSKLYQRNFFIQRHGRSKASYQFHPLFRDFLRTQLKQNSSRAEMQRLQNKAGRILEISEQQEAAIDLYQEGGEFADATRLICDLAPGLLAQGRYTTLRNWITRLPKASIDDTPWLSYWLACCDLFFQPPKARKNFEVAYRCFIETGDTSGIYLSWSGAVDTFLIEGNEYRTLKEWIGRGEQLFSDYPDFPSADIEMRVVASMCFALTYCRPDHAMLPTISARAREMLFTCTDPSRGLPIISMLCANYVWRGEAAKAQLLVKEFAEAGSAPDGDVAWQAFLYSMAALLAFMTGRQKEALQAAKAGLALCDASGFNIVKIYLLGHGAWAALSCGEQSLGRKYVESIGALTSMGHHSRGAYYLLLAWLDWSVGQTTAALEKAKIAAADIEKSGYENGVAFCHLALSILHLELGELRKGRTNLDEALRIAESGDSGWTKFNYYFIDASYKLEQGQELAYLDALRQGFGVGRGLGLYTTLWWDPVRMSRLCATALEHDIEVDYVQEMIRRNRLVPDTAAAALESWPWSIKVYVLGTFRLVIDGKLVGSGGKGQKKVIELLKALVVFGSRDVNATYLTDALWPDSDGDDANNALKTAVHRLRKLLGQPDAIEVSAGHLSLNSEYCWTDLGNFEQLLHDARNEAEDSASLEQALNLYRGPLLSSEEEASWVIAPGERVRSKFLRAVVIAGEYWESKQQWTKAIGVYERALEVDQLVESFYLHLMQCHQNLGHYAEAISTFERCTKILAAELGVEPSHELQSFGNAMRHS